jgi:prepilin-type N-terminal cleavage/methylation domain-containing protein
MSKGFTLIELLIVVMLAAVIIGVVFMSFKGCGNDDIAFAMTTDKDIKLITNPTTGEVSECIRPFSFGGWKCRPVNTGAKKPAEKL